jgi:hypothetical protein
MLPTRTQAGEQDHSDSEADSPTAATTPLGVAGPEFVTTSVHVPEPPTVMFAGPVSATEMSAFDDAFATAIVNGPAVVVPAATA